MFGLKQLAWWVSYDLYLRLKSKIDAKPQSATVSYTHEWPWFCPRIIHPVLFPSSCGLQTIFMILNIRYMIKNMVFMIYDINMIFKKRLDLIGNLITEILEFLCFYCLLLNLMCHGFLEKTLFFPIYMYKASKARYRLLYSAILWVSMTIHKLHYVRFEIESASYVYEQFI